MEFAGALKVIVLRVELRFWDRKHGEVLRIMVTARLVNRETG